MARQISELSNEDFSLLETSAHLPTINLPDQTIEAQLAAVLERLKQEVYFSDSGTVSDLDGPACDGAGSRHNNLSSDLDGPTCDGAGSWHDNLSSDLDSPACDGAGSRHDNLSSDLESEPDHAPQRGTSSEQQCNESCHNPTVGEVRQDTCKPPVARQRASSESGPNSKPVKIGKDVKKPAILTAGQPANQQRVTDFGLQTRFFNPRKNLFDSMLMVNHQSVSTATQKGRQRKNSKRRKPCAAHMQRTTTHYGSHPSHPDPEDRISASFNHQEVVNFLWQGEATQNTAN